MSFIDRDVKGFAEVLASKEPVPGGGGAAALMGAIGIALGNMVGNLTVGKKKYADVQDEVIALMQECETLRLELLSLIDADAEVFEPLSKAYGIPKDDPNRNEIMEKALALGCSVPMDIMRTVAKCLDVIYRLAQIGSQIAISDAGCAAACCKAALQAASLNVFINTKSMNNRKNAYELDREAHAILEKYCPMADEIYGIVTGKIQTAKILDGKEVANAINARVAEEVESLKAQGIEPTLAILRVGERPDDLSYERGATKRASTVGVAVKNVVLPEDASQDDVLAAIDSLNKDDSVHGVLMFRPLPKHIDDETVRCALAPKKDIDGITDGSLAGVFASSSKGFAPCTAEACIEILDYYNIDPKGKRATVIGRSLVIGKPVAMMLMRRNATVSNCHTKTVDVPSITREADIVIAAAGKMETVTADYLKPGQIVIDVGINWNEEKQKLCGDVKFDEAAPIVEAITPVPGGVGSVTTSVLVSHVVEAAKRTLG